MAAAAVVSMDQRSIDYVVVASPTGELTEGEFNSPGIFSFLNYLVLLFFIRFDLAIV